MTRKFTINIVDFAGTLKIQKGIRRVTTKKDMYYSGICMYLTKATNLKSIVGVTNEIFLAVFSRFMVRCGKIANTCNYHGSNFVGVQKKLYAYLADSERYMVK